MAILETSYLNLVITETYYFIIKKKLTLVVIEARINSIKINVLLVIMSRRYSIIIKPKRKNYQNIISEISTLMVMEGRYLSCENKDDFCHDLSKAFFTLR